jgi:putative endonuclease
MDSGFTLRVPRNDGYSVWMVTAKQSYVYILASKPRGTLYVGGTSDLVKRIYQHKTEAMKGFTAKYGVHRLVWFETHDDIAYAIAREKELKKWRRQWKLDLIEESNPHWNDLWMEITR